MKAWLRTLELIFDAKRLNPEERFLHTLPLLAKSAVGYLSWVGHDGELIHGGVANKCTAGTNYTAQECGGEFFGSTPGGGRRPEFYGEPARFDGEGDVTT